MKKNNFFEVDIFEMTYLSNQKFQKMKQPISSFVTKKQQFVYQKRILLIFDFALSHGIKTYLRKVFRGFVESVVLYTPTQLEREATVTAAALVDQQPRAGDYGLVVVPVVLAIRKVIEVVADRKAKALCVSLCSLIRGKSAILR